MAFSFFLTTGTICSIFYTGATIAVLLDGGRGGKVDIKARMFIELIGRVGTALLIFALIAGEFCG